MKTTFPLNGKFTEDGAALLLNCLYERGQGPDKEQIEGDLGELLARKSLELTGCEHRKMKNKTRLFDDCFRAMLDIWRANLVKPEFPKCVINIWYYMDKLERPLEGEESDDEWDNVVWAFPDQVIAKALGVSRQAVAYQRAKRTAKGGSLEEKEKKFRYIMDFTLANLAMKLNLSKAQIKALSGISLSRAKDALWFLPDIDQEKMREAMRLNTETYGPGLISVFWYIATLKNITELEAARLMFAAFREEAEMTDEWIAKGTGCPLEKVRQFRELPESVLECPEIAALPDAGEAKGNNTLDILCAKKGLTEEEAVRLLWLLDGKYGFCV